MQRSRPATPAPTGKPWRPVVALALLLLTDLATAGPSDSAAIKASVEGFVRQLYRGYRLNGKPPRLHEARAGAWLSDALRKAIADNRVALHGEPGLLQVDPLCACQQHDLRLETLDVSAEGPGRARASVTFVNQEWRRTVQLRLQKSGGSWRLDDLAQPTMPSLRQALERETRQAISADYVCGRGAH
ncbi:DUF3828 domain-containing protein [Pseudomonas citronellolis]|uniref:DUF3828 domain-containing protein n=1 Tax=Pseudomonas citronellolis TaxID=53408 RepID=UPI0023E3BAB3|nr:DUF3828 domain-containing protein [Pseudomonas citronellolis]MDF3936052.1 hypothetical protein [Pseudomonas citronellolis]